MTKAISAPPPGWAIRRESSGGFSGRSLIVSSYICAAIAAAFLAQSPALVHWFVIPVLICGILMVQDIVEWIKEMDLFDPIGLVGLLGAHHFFIAPLLHVHWNEWASTVTALDDWRDWLGRMALLNIIGIICYRTARHLVVKRRQQSVRRVWTPDKQRFVVIFSYTAIITVAIQVWVYAKYGGIGGYIDAYLRDYGYAFANMGWLFAISESFPILALCAFATLRRRIRVSPIAVGLVLSLFFLLSVVFGGLRGQRGHILFMMLWAVGIVHYWVRPISKKVVVVGMVLMISFLYLYGFYKTVGIDAFAALRGSQFRAQLEEESGRSLETALLADIARTDIQAYLLFRTTSGLSEYDLAWGRTYAGAAALLIPRAWWPDRPPTKVLEGTNALYGDGSYVPGERESSHVYGLAGEALLNFGPVGVPAMFLLFGLLVGAVRRFRSTWLPGDTRFLLYPMLTTFCLWVLISDSDNQLAFLLRYGVVPGLVLLGSSSLRKVRVLGQPKS